MKKPRFWYVHRIVTGYSSAHVLVENAVFYSALVRVIKMTSIEQSMLVRLFSAPRRTVLKADLHRNVYKQSRLERS